MINSISVRAAVSARGWIFIFYKSEKRARFDIGKYFILPPSHSVCCYTSKYPFPARCDVTRLNDSAREQTINLIIAIRQCRELVLEKCARVYVALAPTRVYVGIFMHARIYIGEPSVAAFFFYLFLAIGIGIKCT